MCLSVKFVKDTFSYFLVKYVGMFVCYLYVTVLIILYFTLTVWTEKINIFNKIIWIIYLLVKCIKYTNNVGYIRFSEMNISI
jgi:hypothetical protein